MTAGLFEELLIESFDKLFVESFVESFVDLLVESLEDNEDEDEAKSFARKSSCFLETFKSRDPTQQST